MRSTSAFMSTKSIATSGTTAAPPPNAGTASRRRTDRHGGNQDGRDGHGGRKRAGPRSRAPCGEGRGSRRSRARQRHVGNARSTGSERHQQVATRLVVESVEIDRAVTLVTEQLDKGRAPLLLRRLQLIVSHPHEVHLERLDQEILGIPAIRTRQRQVKTPFRAWSVLARQARVYPIHYGLTCSVFLARCAPDNTQRPARDPGRWPIPWPARRTRPGHDVRHEARRS